jgi:site-specific DNA-methyltransferase (adenine-specific)
MPKPSLETPFGKLYEADCLDILPTLDAESVDVVFADPPFNLGKVYASKLDDAVQDDEYLEWSYRWMDECVRVLKPGGSFFLYNLPKWNVLLGAHLAKSLTFRHWIAVDIKFSLPISGRLYPSHYSLLYYCKGKKPAIFHPDRLPTPCCRHCGGELRDYGGYKDKMNPKGVNLTDVWADIPPVRHRKYKDTKESQNQLSLKLMDRLICLASDEGSLVLDPFGGSGTTYVAAELLGRRWLGVELHCGDALARFQDLEGDRHYLRQLQALKNTLFTRADLERRAKSGRPLSNAYRIEQNQKHNGDVREEGGLFANPPGA